MGQYGYIIGVGLDSLASSFLPWGIGWNSWKVCVYIMTILCV